MIQRILLATDFSTTSEHAQAMALDLAKKFAATVDILHAVEPIPLDGEDRGLGAFYEKLEKRAALVLGRIGEQFQAAKVPYTTRVIVEKRWSAIVECARREGCDLIVMGSRASDGTPHSLGTTSHKVFLTSTVPVLFVRA